MRIRQKNSNFIRNCRRAAYRTSNRNARTHRTRAGQINITDNCYPSFDFSGAARGRPRVLNINRGFTERLGPRKHRGCTEPCLLPHSKPRVSL
jgi:hypothetical protein